MYRAVARVRTLIALLLLVVGQLGAAVSARAAPCPRAARRHSVAAATSTAAASGVLAAFVTEHDHSSSPVGEHPAAPSSSCGSAIALPERIVDLLLPIPPAEDAPARVTSPPGDPFASSFFRPPRLS